MYKEPDIEKKPPINPQVMDARQAQALKVFLSTPNITRGPISPPAGLFAPPMGGFSSKPKSTAPKANEYGMVPSKGRNPGSSVGGNVYRRYETASTPADALPGRYDTYPNNTEDNYGNFAAFAEGGDVEVGGESEDERKLREAIAAQQANSGDFQAAQQTFLGTPTTAAPPLNITPPAPGTSTYAPAVQAVYQQNPQLAQIAAGEAQANNVDANLAQLRDYMPGGVKGPQYGPAPVPTPQEVVQQWAASGNGPNVTGAIGDVAKAAGNVPLLNAIPGGAVINQGLNAAGVETPSILEARNAVNDAVFKPYVVPASDALAQAGGEGFKALQMMQAFGTPGGRGVDPKQAEAAGRFVGGNILPRTPEMALLQLLTAPKGASLLQRLDPIGISTLGGDAVQAAPSMGRFAPDAVASRTASENVLRANRAEMGIVGAASQPEPLASILKRADAGDTKITAAYLRSVADDRGIDLAGATKKADVLAAIRASNVPAPTQGQVVRLAVQPDAMKPLDPNSLMGSRGATELTDPSKARILAAGEEPGPGEVLMNHGTGNGGLRGDLQPGMNLSPNPEDAQVFARTATKFEDLSGVPVGAARNEGANVLPDANWRPPEPGNLPVNDPDKYVTSQLYSRLDAPNPPVKGLANNEIRTRLYNAGFDSNGTAAELQARYAQASDAGIKLPYKEAPSDLPDTFDLARAGRTPQSPMAAPQSPELDASIRANRLSGASQRVDSYMQQAARENVYPPQDVRALAPEDALTESRRLGGVMDEDAFARGTPLTRDLELNKLQKAADAETERLISEQLGTMGRAEEAVMAQNREMLLDRATEESVDGVKGPATQFLESQNGIDSQAQRVIGGIAPTSEMPAGARMAERYGAANVDDAARHIGVFGKVFNWMREASYIPMMGDIGGGARQAGPLTLNIANAKHIPDIASDIARSSTDVGNTRAVDDLLDMLASRTAKFDRPIDLHLASWNTSDIANREVMGSAGLGRIPLVGAPFNVTGRMNTMAINSPRIRNYVEFLDNHPNLSWAQAQTGADLFERLSGRGKLGTEWFDKAFADKAGSLFTSLRYPLGIVESHGYLLPWTRLADGSMEIGGPVWREAVKQHAGFYGTTATVLGAATAAGLNVDWKKGEISDGVLHVPLWGGAAPIFTMIHQLATGEKNNVPYPSILGVNNEGQLQGTVAEYVRNRLSPLLGIGFAGAKLTGLDEKLGVTNEMQFLRPDYWDKGMFGLASSEGKILDQALNVLTPLWIQEVVNAYKTAEDTNRNPITNALITAATGFLGFNTSNYGGQAERERSAARNDVIFHQPREQVFGPDLNRVIPPNTPYAQLGSREKELVNAQMSPAELKAFREQAIKDGNKGELVQQQREEVKASYKPSFDKLDQALKAGTMTPYQVRAAASALERHMYDRIDAIKYPEKDSSGNYTPPAIQQAESGYRALFDKAPKTEDGKPDYDALKNLQTNYLAAVAKSQGSDFAARLAYNVLPRVTPTDSPIQQFYDRPEMKQAVAAYNADGVNKTAYRIENPQANALLYAGGYVRTLDTPDAVEAYKRYSNGVPEINFTVGFKQDGFVSYAGLISGSPLGNQVKEYQALPSGEGNYERPDYLRAHPELNILLWQTAHTSKAYSLQAYEAMRGAP